VQALARRGLHRTALEACKLLLALNDEDPMGALCCIDYLAVRAGRYQFLERFVETYGGDGSAGLLPNFPFSLALGRWYQEQGELVFTLNFSFKGWFDAAFALDLVVAVCVCVLHIHSPFGRFSFLLQRPGCLLKAATPAPRGGASPRPWTFWKGRH
jgi:hypothetical protein